MIDVKPKQPEKENALEAETREAECTEEEEIVPKVYFKTEHNTKFLYLDLERTDKKGIKIGKEDSDHTKLFNLCLTYLNFEEGITRNSIAIDKITETIKKNPENVLKTLKASL